MTVCIDRGETTWANTQQSPVNNTGIAPRDVGDEIGSSVFDKDGVSSRAVLVHIELEGALLGRELAVGDSSRAE